MTRVLVTGAGGFIGSHLVERLLDRGDEVTVLDLTPPEAVRTLADSVERVRWVTGDIRDDDALRQAFEGDPEVVYHLASVVGVHHYVRDPLAVVDVVVGGTRRVLEQVEACGAHLVYTSTSEVFGRNPEVPWHEDADRVLGSTSVDRWSYGSSKAVAEHMIHGMARRGLSAAIVRFFNAYGPRQLPDYVVSRSVWKVLRGERPVIYDDGSQTRCFTWIGDIVEGLVEVGVKPEASGHAFNLGRPVESTMEEVVRTILQHAGVDLEPVYFDTEAEWGGRYEDIPRRVPGVERAREVLGWEARTPLDEGIRRTLEWARENPWWLEERKGPGER